MKFGISTYSLHQAFKSGQLTIAGVIETIAELGAEHVEIVPLGYNLVDQPELIPIIKHSAQQTGLELSNYAIQANFSDLSTTAFQQEIERVKSEVDVCAELGIRKMRHDIAFSKDISYEHFIKELPAFVAAATQISEYAEQYHITTSIENHGFYVQHSKRVRKIVEEVNRHNFKMTVDIGNFLCVDENPVSAVGSSIELASMVHVKDFYIRPATHIVSEGWFQSASGQWLRGSILGQGDIEMMKVLQLVKDSQYDDYISLEFEGMEECVKGTRLGFEYLKKAWQLLD